MTTREKVQKKIENIMDGEEKQCSSLTVKLLSALSMGYQSAVQSRNFFFNSGLTRIKKLPCKVISIGNLCVGGAGKTPFAMYVANLVKKLGFNVCVVSRGYKGRAEEKGGIVGDGQQVLMSAEEAGDEPFMMAQALTDIPILVGKDRYRSGKVAVDRFNAEVIVLDDAFQHRRLFRDIDLVLLDGRLPFGNGRLLPRGRLREPIGELVRSHGVIFSRTDKSIRENIRTDARFSWIFKNRPVFFAAHKPNIHKIILPGKEQNTKRQGNEAQETEVIEGKRAVAFSGLAVNQNFKHTLEELNIDILNFMDFPDHHKYALNEIEIIGREAVRFEADCIVTTEKDFVKLPNGIEWPIKLVVLGISISLEEDEQVFERFIEDHLSGRITAV